MCGKSGGRIRRGSAKGPIRRMMQKRRCRIRDQLRDGGTIAAGCMRSGESEERMAQEMVRPRVLVADDERVIADTLAMILNQSGFEARAVYSGEKALAEAASFQPKMLISDVIMADLNGIDAAIRIREMLPEIKILLFSGQAATADLLEKARARGYEFEILAKPVHPQDLLSRLRS
jgi:CheY-like chemotaxis protein